MKRSTPFRFSTALRKALETFRPRLETLEDRLPPGDAFFSGVLARGMGGPAPSTLAAPPAAVALTGAFRPSERPATPATVPADAGYLRPTFAAADYSRQASRSTTVDGSVSRTQPRPGTNRSVALDPNLLDSLLGDDWDEPAVSKPRHLLQPSSAGEPAQPATFLEGGGSVGPGSKDPQDSRPPVQPVTPAHGDIVPFPAQGLVPPDNGRTPPPPGSGGGMPPLTPPEDDDCACNSSGQLNGNESGSTGGYDTGREFSDGPVRYFDGTVKYMATDLVSNGFGDPWGVTRTWTNGGWVNNGPGPSTNGSGIVVSQQPFLRGGGTTVAVVINSWDYHIFMLNAQGVYQAAFFDGEYLVYSAASHTFSYSDSRGDSMLFHDLTPNWPPSERGTLADYHDPAGNDTSSMYDGSGHLMTVQHSTSVGGTTTYERLMYNYNPSGLVSSVALQRSTDGSNWSTWRQVGYGYYYGDNRGNGDQYGNAGDLRSATIMDGATPTPNVLDVYYYRYYTNADMGSIGYVGGLKYVFGPQSCARLVAAGMGDPLQTGLTDAQVQNYADNYFQYNGAQQVSLERVQGQGCACGGGNAGQGTYTFTYSTSSFSAGFNNWTYKTVETLPDNIPGVHTSQNVVYANAYGQVMLKVYQQQDAGGPLSQWATYYKYDIGDGMDIVGGGRTIMKAYPSAISGFSESIADLVDGYLNSTTGLVETTDYYTMTSPNISDTQAGGVAGYVQDRKIQQGQSGTPALQSYQEYFAHSVGGTTVYPVADTRVYKNATTDPNDSSKEQTNYSYTWYGTGPRIYSMIVGKPPVSNAENGPGNSDVDTTFYDPFGRPTWHRNSINPPDNQTADGYIDYTAYDPNTGAVTESIKDVDTTQTQDFVGLVPTDPHTGMQWMTLAGAGKHLKTTMVVDGQGRTIQSTSPSANLMLNRAGNIVYTVYDDPHHAVRTYTWDAVANVQIGPTLVYREDRQQPTSYTETITMTAPANLTGGKPDGSEMIADIQSLSRSFTSPGGLMIEKDDYFNFGNLAYTQDPVLPGAAAGVNFYQTFYGYDDGRGWLDRVQSPTGTIQRTVYDGLHRVTSTWVGTNDTVAATVNTPVDLSSAFNRTGIISDGVMFDTMGGLDGHGHAYSANLLNGNVTWNGLPFTIGPAGANDVVAGGPSVTVNLPAGRDAALTLLATGVNGYQNPQTFTVTYTDLSTQPFSTPLSNWLTPQNSTNESTAVSLAHYNNANGTQSSQPAYLYAYTFLLNPAKQVKSLTLPITGNVVLLAATLTAAPWSPTNNGAPANMVQVTGNVYDNGGVGDSNLTQATQYPGGGAAPRVTQNVFDWRDRVVVTKQGVQGTEDTTTHRPIMYMQYDNLDEVTLREQYDSDTKDPTMFLDSNGNPKYPSLRRASTATLYDDQGRVYRSQTFDIVQSGPNAGQVQVGSNMMPLPPLVTNTYYDHRGNVIETAAPGGLVTKTVYDGADRPTVTYTTDGRLDTGWSDPPTLANNNVLEQTETTYDADSNPILTVTRQRFHDETTTGPLVNPGTSPKARVSYMASYYDAADRMTAQADYGTNGGATFVRPNTVPARSDTILVTTYGYLADTVQQVALSGTLNGSFTLTVNINGTNYPTQAILLPATATSVQSALNAALMPVSGSVQVSGPTNGPWNVRFIGSLAGTPVATMTGTATGFTVTVGTTSEGGDTGRQQQVTDPRGLVQKADYDLLSRTARTIDAYANFAPSNGSDRTTEYTYDGDNHVLTLTACLPSTPNNIAETTQYVYGVTGSIINSNDLLHQVAYPDNGQPHTDTYTYDALGETATLSDRNGSTHAYTYDVLGRQISDTVTVLGNNVDSSVRRLDTAYDTGDRPYLYTSYADTAGMTVANQVQQVYNGLGQLITEYQSHSGAVTGSTPSVQYAYNEMTNGANNSRPTSMTYPNGRVLNDKYASGVDDTISRLTSLSDSSATLEVDSYLGLNTVVQRSYPQASVSLTYIQQAGDTQANHDAGDQYTGLDRFGRVIDQFWVTNAAATLDRFQYGYDRDGNVLYRANLVTEGLPSPLPFDELYQYDNFNQLTSFGRGTLNAGRSGWNGTPTHTQGWTLDPLGNWQQFTNDGTPQNRTNNSQNQITSISGATTPTYDNSGNTTTDQRGVVYTFDPWNRLASVSVGPLMAITYGYDALGRRITDSSTSLDLYYSSSWQVLEERSDGAVQTQYVWSPGYVDALIERDTSSGRLYVQQDANWNVTAVDGPGIPNWAPAERYVYDPYGAPTVLNAATWTAQSSQYNWIYLFQGGRYDGLSGLYYFRNRDYAPTLGRWMEQDPALYAAGDSNLYRFEYGGPENYLDPLGLKGGHHWIRQAPTLRGRIQALCPHLDVHDFTSNRVLVEPDSLLDPFGTPLELPLGRPGTHFTIHSFLEYEFGYQKKFEDLLAKAKTCCDLLLGTKKLMDEALEAYSKKWLQGRKVTAPLEGYKNDKNNTSKFNDLIDKCNRTKCADPFLVPAPAPATAPAPGTSGPQQAPSPTLPSILVVPSPLSPGIRIPSPGVGPGSLLRPGLSPAFNGIFMNLVPGWYWENWERKYDPSYDIKRMMRGGSGTAL